MAAIAGRPRSEKREGARGRAEMSDPFDATQDCWGKDDGPTTSGASTIGPANEKPWPKGQTTIASDMRPGDFQ